MQAVVFSASSEAARGCELVGKQNKRLKCECHYQCHCCQRSKVNSICSVFLRLISPFETPQPGLKCSNVLFLRGQRAKITKILPWYAPCGRWEGMETRRRVETIYELLDGCGYFHWLVAAATDANSQTPETRYVLVNFKDRKKPR